jgi:hypothetical protein
MGLAATEIDQMHDTTPRHTSASATDRYTVTALRTHSQPLVGRPANECLNGATKCRVSMGAGAAERRINQCPMRDDARRDRRPPARAPPLVPMACRQAHGKRLTRELWMTALSRGTAGCRSGGHARMLQDREERFGRPGTVPDGQHNGHLFSCPHWPRDHRRRPQPIMESMGYARPPKCMTGAQLPTV